MKAQRKERTLEKRANEEANKEKMAEERSIRCYLRRPMHSLKETTCCNCSGSRRIVYCNCRSSSKIIKREAVIRFPRNFAGRTQSPVDKP